MSNDSYENISTKKNKHLNTITYMLVKHLIRKVGIYTPSDIVLCLLTYCGEFEYKFKINDVKIWIFSWNMSFIKTPILAKELQQIIPIDYDIYVFGIQETLSYSISNANKKTISNSFFDVVASYFQYQIGYNILKGSFSSKSTGVAVYYKRFILCEHISIHSKPSISEGVIPSNKGCACLILNIYSIKVLLMSIDYPDCNKLETFMTKCHKKLGEQYKHIICFGTFQNTYINPKTETQIPKLMNVNALEIWKYDSFKQLLISPKQDNSILRSFKEPHPMINFYPTYPKHKNRKYDFPYHSNKIELQKIYQLNNKQLSFCDRLIYASFDYFNESTLLPILNTSDYNSFKHVSHNYNAVSNYFMQSEHSPIYCGMILTINNEQMKQIKLTIHSHNGHHYKYHPKNLLDGSNFSGTHYESKKEVTSGDWIVFKIEMNNPIKPTKIRIINSYRDSGICSISLFIGSNNKFFPLCPNVYLKNLDRNPQERVIGDKLFLSDYFLSTNKLNLIKIKILCNYGNPWRNTFYSFELFGFEYA